MVPVSKGRLAIGRVDNCNDSIFVDFRLIKNGLDSYPIKMVKYIAQRDVF